MKRGEGRRKEQGEGGGKEREGEGRREEGD